MRMQLSQQPEELLGNRALGIIVERVDEGALRIAQMLTRGFPAVVDRPMPRPWTPRGLRWGWTAVRGLASILTAGDHRKVSVEASIRGMQHTLSPRSKQGIEAVDFRDDRLGHLLQHVRKPTYGPKSERDVQARSLEGYDWPQEVSRWDATTVSGDHEVPEGGLWQCGQRNEEPTRPQSQGMRGALDPLGMPLSTEVLAGARAEEGLAIPILERLRRGWNTTGRLCVGDGTMRAVETRRHVVGHHDFSLSPLP